MSSSRMPEFLLPWALPGVRVLGEGRLKVPHQRGHRGLGRGDCVDSMLSAL